MSKEYFPHDYGARLSLRGIRKDFGLQGLGFYWCFVEILHEEGGYIKESDLDNIAYDLQVAPELCYAITHNYDLFTVKKGKICSERVLRNIKKRAEISAARQKAARDRWDNSPPPEEQKPEPLPVPVLPDDEAEERSRAADENFESGVEFYTDQVNMRCDMWEDELKEKGTSAFDLFSSPPAIIKPRLTSLFELIKGKRQQKINGQTVGTLEVMQAVVDFFTSDEKRWALYNLIIEVDEKAASGEIKNKQNYLVSALYNAAKMNGA